MLNKNFFELIFNEEVASKSFKIMKEIIETTLI